MVYPILSDSRTGRRPETRFLSAVSPISPVWRAEADGIGSFSRSGLPERVLSEGATERILAHPADRDGRAILTPVDPVILLLRHRDAVERLRTALGSQRLFESHVLPMLFAWAAVVQSLPREARGLWSGADGFFEAGLDFARGTLNAADARVLEPTMPPSRRARWTDRLRVAAMLAGLLSDADRLAALRLEAGGVDRESGRFEPIETHAVGEETALAFGVRHVGRWMRLTRLSWVERSGRSPSPGLDLLRLIVRSDTLAWLGDFERQDGETVLSALKSALMFGTGRSLTERLIAESVARGREWAVNRRADRAARREGVLPVLAGFGEIVRHILLTRLERRQWTINAEGSPLVWAEDGLFLRWPEGFVAMVASCGDGASFREVPDEPDVAAQILLASGVIDADPAGEALWWSDPSEDDPQRKAWVRLSDEMKLVNLAREEARRRGEPLPARLARLTGWRPRAPRERWSVLPGRFVWRLTLPALTHGATPSESRRMLCRAVARLNARSDAALLGSVRGLLVPESLLGEAFRWDEPDLARVFRLLHQMPGSFFPGARATAVHRVRYRGEDAVRLADLSPERRPDTAGHLILEGVLIQPYWLRPTEVWEDGTEEERPMPETGGRLEWLDGGEKGASA